MCSCAMSWGRYWDVPQALQWFGLVVGWVICWLVGWLRAGVLIAVERRDFATPIVC